MKELSKGRTMLIVAYRPSTIKSTDRIIMLDEGRVVDNGAYEELIGKEGAFKYLMATECRCYRFSDSSR